MTKGTGGQRPTKTRPKKVATLDQCRPHARQADGRTAGYGEWLTDLKERIHAAQQRAELAVNRELLTLYWQLGRDILDRQERAGGGGNR